VSQFAAPRLVFEDGASERLQRVPLAATDGAGGFSELWLQQLLFSDPSILPIEEIDVSFAELVPICMELGTRVGPIDALFVTPAGKLVVLETKLWRNPQARREVVGQVLDYAKELRRWGYADLQREVSRRTSQAGNALFDITRARVPELDEATFVDNVSKSLRHGDFLLLICGDGIREEVESIAEYLDPHGTLHFTLALIETAVYQASAGHRYVQPRVLAKTEIIRRTVVTLKSDHLTATEDPADEAEQDDKQPRNAEESWYLNFWQDFIDRVVFDDVTQSKPNATRFTHVFIPMPKGSTGWITVYFSLSGGEIGLFLTFTRGPLADRIYEELHAHREDIEEELGFELEWQSSADSKYRIARRREYSVMNDDQERSVAMHWFLAHANPLVNAFRHRIKEIVEER